MISIARRMPTRRGNAQDAAAVRGERNGTIRGRKVGVVRGDDEVAGVHEGEPESRHGALHLADHGVGHAVERFDSGMQAGDHALEATSAIGGFAVEHAGKRPDVAACHEVLACPADHDDAQCVVGRDVRGCVDQRIHECKSRAR